MEIFFCLYSLKDESLLKWNYFYSIGDVILREEPYAAVLEAIFRANHCAHCMKKTPTPIPCYECSTVRP